MADNTILGPYKLFMPYSCIRALAGRLQCDQIGRFFIVLVENFSCKNNPNVWNFLGYFETQVKTDAATFWVPFGKIGLLLISTSGHTARQVVFVKVYLQNFRPIQCSLAIHFLRIRKLRAAMIK